MDFPPRPIGLISKSLAHYRKQDHPLANCGNCAYMKEDGTCEQVEGKVRPKDVCDYWKTNAREPHIH